VPAPNWNDLLTQVYTQERETLADTESTTLTLRGAHPASRARGYHGAGKCRSFSQRPTRSAAATLPPSNVSRLRLLPWLLALSAVSLAGLFWELNTRWNREVQAAVRETLSAREAMAETLSLLKDAETGVRGYLLTDAPKFLEPHARALPGIEAHLARLAQLARTDGAQQAATQQLLALSRRKLELLQRLIERRRGGEIIVDRDSLALLEEGKGAMDAIRAEIAAMLAREDQRLQQRERAAAAAASRLEILTGLALLGGISIALGGLSAAQREAQRAKALNQQLVRDIAARAEAESALRQQSALQQLILENIGDGVVVMAPDKKALVMNPAARQIMPFAAGDVLPRDWSEQSRAYLADGITLFPPERGPLTRGLEGHSSDAVEMAFRVASGELRSYSVTTRPISIDGQVVAAVAVFRDSTERKTAARELLESEQRYRVLADASFEGVAITKAGIILDTNENFARWLGYEPRELAGRQGLELFSAPDRERVLQAAGNSDLAYEAEMLRRDGTTFPVEVRGRFLQFRDERVRIAVVRDITEKKQREAELEALSLRDVLTGLYNRRGFLELVGHELKAAERKRRHCALFYADLDGMKQINDQLGHALGDQALSSTAELLQRVFRRRVCHLRARLRRGGRDVQPCATGACCRGAQRERQLSFSAVVQHGRRRLGSGTSQRSGELAGGCRRQHVRAEAVGAPARLGPCSVGLSERHAGCNDSLERWWSVHREMPQEDHP
jgi:PAS domain S-box-containing protein